MLRYAVIGGSVFAGCVGYGYFSSTTQGLDYQNSIRADDKVAIVTGANTGIGFETARELAERGAKVYMACRDLNKCNIARDNIVETTSNPLVYCRECDLSSQQSIRKFVQNFREGEKRLDILINNAGVMGVPKSSTIEGIETHLGVNHMGPFLLTNLLLDMLKTSAPSRIIIVSSITHHWAQIKIDDLNCDENYDALEAYNQSKLANILFTKELAKRLANSGVTVNAVHPGFCHTQITRQLGGRREIFNPFYKSPKSGAQTTIFAALEPGLENITGKYFSNLAEAKISEAAKEDAVAKWLWRVSAKWTGLETK